MEKNQDQLYHYFEKHLHKTDVDYDSDTDFVRQVVYDYWQCIQGVGFISGLHSDEILEDLENEVSEMLKKTIYGFFSLKEFRASFK